MIGPFYRAFEDRHRGSRELITDRLRVYLPFVLPLQGIYSPCAALDLGCGRGEWLELLIQQGFDAKGVDLDAGMLEACATLKLPATQDDAVSALSKLADESVAIVSGFHIAEHIPFTELQSLVANAMRVLKPGGLLILETPNAENIVVGANNFYLDPTHERPLPHLLLSFLIEHSGFARHALLRLHEPQNVENADNVSLMEVLGSASPDYAIVAQKHAEQAHLDMFEGAFNQHYGVALDHLASRYDQGIQRRLEQTAMQGAVQVTQLSQDVAAQFLKLGDKVQTLELNNASELNNTKQEMAELGHRFTAKFHELRDQLHAVELNTVKQDAEDIARELQHVQQQLMDSQANAHHWYLGHEEARRRLEEIQRSTSWRITAPLRLTVRLLRAGVRSPLTIARRVNSAMRKPAAPLPRSSMQAQLFIDISELMQRDAKTGIQRVVRSILTELLNNPPAGFDVRPVFASKGDSPMQYYSGDIFLGLDLQHQVVISHSHEYTKMRNAGVKIYFVIYDLLPIFMPNSFWQGASHMHADWLSVIAQNDGAICISKAVADEYYQWLKDQRRLPRGEFNIGWFHLGADLSSSTPTSGLPENAPAVLKNLETRPTFVTVGTVEPRKGHAQILASFDLLWKEGVDVNLVLVGKQGWNVEELADEINNHAEFGQRLIWAGSASDEYLEEIYKRSSCLVSASLGEGFGLPLIEAAQHGVPIIARDLPVFQEVAGDNALYFSGHEAGDLAGTVKQWLDLHEKNAVPLSTNMQWLTWEQSAGQLKGTLFNGQWYWKTSKAALSDSSSANNQ
jgi:glycosyltransferase involved in cell wall biosynthesis/SAM-dependent methyltransferase